MFAGKTTTLLKKIKYYKTVLKKKVLVFKPILDQRFAQRGDFITSHDFLSHLAISVKKSTAILEHIFRQKKLPEIVFFDEIHLFTENFSQIIDQLLKKGIKVVCAGLKKDFRNNVFPVVADFLRLEPEVEKLFADCYKCPQKATNSQRLIANDAVILVGGKNIYAPACDRCFNKYEPQFVTGTLPNPFQKDKNNSTTIGILLS